MTEILLTSELFVKSVSNISDNLAGQYLLPAIREAQEINLRGIVGDALLDKLKSLASSNALQEPANVYYKAVVDRCQYFLAYQTIAGLPYKLGYKLANIGVAKISDTNVQPCSADELPLVGKYYQNKADYYAKLLQQYLLNNSKQLPELTAHDCRSIRANLHSAASCGIWLGGARGKIIR